MKEEIIKLQKVMHDEGVDIYLVPLSDYHSSEYISQYFMEIPYLTGFTGSNATLVVTDREACMWTDGRYFLQAETELAGSGVKLMKQGLSGVPTVFEYIESFIQPKKGLFKKKDDKQFVLGFDGRLITASTYERYNELVSQYSLSIKDKNLVDLIFEERASLSCKPVWILDRKYCGESTKEKLSRVRQYMKENHCNMHIVSDLCDIAWILNLRGNDVESVPVFLSYMILTDGEAILYIQEKALDENVKRYLLRNHISIKAYSDIYNDLASDNFYMDLLQNSLLNNETYIKIMCDFSSINSSIYSLASRFADLYNHTNPSTLYKAVKNSVEIENTKRAHLKDALAMVDFMYYLKTECFNNSSLKETEISLSDYLYNLRAGQEGFLELSFDTISAYGSNGAIVHYTASQETNAQIKPEGLYLVDSGGHYLEGTTDITRTFAMGPVTDDMKEKYTLVLKANLRLANARFLEGCTGENLDVLARGPLWDQGLDYRHGTGHGVGHILSVHEGPNAFRYRIGTGMNPTYLQPGMITTDEPGVYITDQYGIRLENELLCIEKDTSQYGRYLGFEVLTYVPFDKDCIDVELLTEQEQEWLDEYHAYVLQKLSPYIEGAKLDWLQETCNSIRSSNGKIINN